MITQKQFDRAYEAIVRLRDKVTEARASYHRSVGDSGILYREAYGQEKGLSQALILLEDADRGDLEETLG